MFFLLLQRRLMENEKIAFHEDRIKKSRQQRKIIEMLQKEQEQLQGQLSAIMDGPHAKKERQMEEKLRRLNDDIETNQKLLDIEKANLWELEGHIKKLHKEIDRLRTNQVIGEDFPKQIFCDR